VDVAVTRHARVYCGSGKQDVDMLVAVADILQHAGAQVVDVAAGSREARQLQQQADEAEAGTLLPSPWAPGSEMVRLVGVVAQRRRWAAVLLRWRSKGADAGAGWVLPLGCSVLLSAARDCSVLLSAQRLMLSAARGCSVLSAPRRSLCSPQAC
jgi:hypothetical protein